MHLLILSQQAWSLDKVALLDRSVRITQMQGEIATALDAVVAADPDIVLIDNDGTSDFLIKNLTELQNLLPHCVIVPVCADPRPDFLLQLIHIGIPDVLLEISTPKIFDLLDRIDNRQARLSSKDRKDGRCMAFMSTKGGAGATLIAVNLALARARAAPSQRGLLIDAALPFGDADIFLNATKANHHLGDFHENIERLDAALFSAMVHKIESNLDFIPAPPTFQTVIEMDAELVSALIRKANLFYDFVVIDISSRINPFSAAILENVERICLIGTPDILGARHAAQIIRLFEELAFPSDKLLLCLNRQTSYNQLTIKDFAETAGKAVSITIPEETGVMVKSISLGRPVIDVAPKSRFACVINDWASELCGVSHKRKSLWHRLKGN
jgi:pilus assembly protein CpaE